MLRGSVQDDVSHQPRWVNASWVAALASVLLCVVAITATSANDGSGQHASDAVVRSAMETIRAAVVNNHSLVTHRRMPVSQAHQFASDVKRETARIRSDAQLSTDAKAAIEPILAQLESGAEAVAKVNTKMSDIEGIVAMDEALAAYAKAFEHPGWKKLREL